MDDARAFDVTPPEARVRSLATSLLGGAILATVATASLGQTYVSNVATLGATSVPLNQFVILGGYYVDGDGGGGTLLPFSPTGGCPNDGGLYFKDVGHCFIRAEPTNSVREWGALCDVVSVNSVGTLTAVWNPGSGTNGAIVVPTAMLLPPPTNSATKQYIVISQIGGPTIWVKSTSTITSAAVPAVSMTRFSILGGAQANYAPGDVISFMGSISSGTFSQQAAIVVDAVSSGGTITQWHFLWGGLYQATALPTGAMVQDNSRSSCGAVVCGTGAGQAGGAVLTPAWSGWSLLNNQTILSRGTGYAVGAIVTLGATGDVAYTGHSPRLIVEGTTTSGGVSAYDWLDYGSFSGITSTGTLTDQNTIGASGLSFSPVAWTQGPFATTIDTVTTTGTLSNIFLTDKAPFPATMTVQSFYYGDDDYAAINRALTAAPASALVVPAGCGTTQPLNLSRDSSANSDNPALIGSNPQSSGLYAFAYPLANRGVHSGAPVLSRVLYGGLVNATSNGFLPTSGGGFRNLFVEGFGVPEGYGYFGLVNNTGTPTGYAGPAFGVVSGRYNIPTAGSAVEIDAASLMHIDDVHIADGGIGAGDSALQCGLDESDPGGTISGAVATIAFTNSRLDSNPAFVSGSTNPDFALRLGASCRGSVYRNLTAYDGGKADVLQYNGNVLTQIHVDSGATFAGVANGPLPTINWGPIGPTFGLAGVADYGVYVIGATSLSQTVCGIANVACVFTLPGASGSINAGQITDTQMRCGAFSTVPTGYFGVELGSGTTNTAVGGTASAGKCAISPSQLVRLDAPGDLSGAGNSLCNNSNALVAGCSGYQGGFAGAQFYTQPAVSYGTVALTRNKLYAAPFFSPASSGAITKLGLDVTTVGGAGSQCEVGLYNAFAGIPTTLIVDGGALAVTSMGTVATTGTFSVQLAPQTLYFLAVGCSGSVTLEGAVAGGGLGPSLIGAPDYTNTSTRISAAWTFAAGALPMTFAGSGTISSAAGDVPNVFAGP